MRRLLLLRHAKSSWDNAGLDDISRPLSARGRKAAPRIGRHISGHDLVPDLLLCSTAERARETLELVTAEWEHAHGEGTNLEMRASLYLATAGEMLAAIKRLGDGIESAMIIGHNPGMALMAGQLCTKGDAGGMQRMEAKFPTAALAVINLDVPSWSAVGPGAGFLQSFVRPKDLL